MKIIINFITQRTIFCSSILEQLRTAFRLVCHLVYHLLIFTNNKLYIKKKKNRRLTTKQSGTIVTIEKKNKDDSLFRRRTWRKKKSLPSIKIKRWPRLIHPQVDTIYTQLISSLLHNFNNYQSKQLSSGVFSTLSPRYRDIRFSLHLQWLLLFHNHWRWREIILSIE
jgi:hypothetical protein